MLVCCGLQMFLVEDGKPINMADYEGLIVLEEHIDQVHLLISKAQQWSAAQRCFI